MELVSCQPPDDFPTPRGVEDKCGNNKTKAWKPIRYGIHVLVDKNHGQILL